MGRRDFILLIPNGQQPSNEYDIDDENGARGPMTFTFLAPGTLPETVKLQVCGPTRSFCDQPSTGQDIALAAGKASTVIIANATAIRLFAGAGVAEARIFEVLWNVTNR